MIDKVPTLTLGQKVCSRCRNKISEIPEPTLDLHDTDSHSSRDSVAEILQTDVVVDSLNNSLQILGETPIKKKRLNEKNYPKNKVEKFFNFNFNFNSFIEPIKVH